MMSLHDDGGKYQELLADLAQARANVIAFNASSDRLDASIQVRLRGDALTAWQRLQEHLLAEGVL